MTRCSGSLALAASSNARSRENRLTEIYAVALEAHSHFADRVFQLAGLDRAPHYEAFTQETLRDGAGRLDLRVYGVTSRELGKRTVLAILYGEHKEPHGELGPDQPEKYLPELRRERRYHGAVCRLLLILGAPEDADGGIPGHARLQSRHAVSRAETERQRTKPARDGLVTTTTWHEIATCAELSGRDAFAASHPDNPDPRAWRDDAAEPNAVASQRVLLELVTYFETEGYAVTNGLTAEQIERAAGALEIENTLGALLDATTVLILAHKFGRHHLEKKRGAREARGQEFKAPYGSWVKRCEGTLWIGYEVEGGSLQAPGEAHIEFDVGVWLPKAATQVIGSRKAFKSQISRFDSDLSADGAIWTATPLAQLITTGPSDTLESQAKHIAAWAAPKLQDLLRLKPGRYPV